MHNMIDIQVGFCTYLQALIGVHPVLRPHEVKGLPFYILSMYDLKITKLENRQLLLCFVITENFPTPAQLEKHAALLRNVSGLETVLVFPRLDSWNRKRLIERRIPFCVPGKQLYLPSLLIDLREHFLVERKVPIFVSYPAQFLIITHLMRRTISGLSVRDLARHCKYSAITMSRAVDELIQLGLAETQKGKNKPLLFRMDEKGLWANALPHLRSPVKSVRYWLSRDSIPPWPISGIEALSRKSDLNPDDRDCRAVLSRNLKPYEERNLVGVRAMTDTDLLIEVWAYDPESLGEGNIVDPFSLYLSLSSDSDERVQLALATMISEIL